MRRRATQSHELPARCQLTSLGSHSVLTVDISRSTVSEPQLGHGGLGLVESDRNSSNRVSHDSHRYS